VEIEKDDETWNIIHNPPEAQNAMDPLSALE